MHVKALKNANYSALRSKLKLCQPKLFKPAHLTSYKLQKKKKEERKGNQGDTAEFVRAFAFSLKIT